MMMRRREEIWREVYGIFILGEDKLKLFGHRLARDLE
jgi:hypothetical protein